MEARYDLFELPPGGFPQWIGSAIDLPEAKKKMYGLPKPKVGGQYLIRDFHSGAVADYTVGPRPPTA